MANEADVHGLVTLRWEWRHKDGTEDMSVHKQEFLQECADFLKKGLQDGTWVYWLAVEDREIIASICVKRIRKAPTPHKLHGEIGYLTNTYTKPEYRNQGIGAQLLDELASWCKDQGMELLFVWPGERSGSFYARQGFSRENDILELVLNPE